MFSHCPSYRRGISFAVDPSEADCQLCLFGLFCCIVFIAIPIFCFLNEMEFRDRMVAFNEIEDHIRMTVHCKAYSSLCECLLEIGSSSPVHLTSDSRHMQITGNATDHDFNVVVKDALEIERSTEYCQWDEDTTQVCETCTRTGSDGKAETYDCNCVKTYHYTKAWRFHRINSLIFNQPATYYNPQRDPYPSVVLPSLDARIGDVPIHSAVLRNAHSHLRATARHVEWTHTGQREPSWSDGIYRFFGFTPGAGRRFETIADLNNVRTSKAAKAENFLYVGQARHEYSFLGMWWQGGYFFSPHIASQTETFLKFFGEVFEGSFLDFQLGDLMASCTAGDIRVSFKVRDPREVSVLSGMATPLVAGEGGGVYLDVFKTTKDYELGLVQEGTRNPFDMMAFELSEAKWWCFWGRLALVLWGMMALPMVSAAAGRFVPHATAFWLGAVGLGGCMLALIWVCLWGVEVNHSWHELATSLLLVVSVGLVAMSLMQCQRAKEWGLGGLLGFFYGSLSVAYPPKKG